MRRWLPIHRGRLVMNTRVAVKFVVLLSKYISKNLIDTPSHLKYFHFQSTLLQLGIGCGTQVSILGVDSILSSTCNILGCFFKSQGAI